MVIDVREAGEIAGQGTSPEPARNISEASWTSRPTSSVLAAIPSGRAPGTAPGQWRSQSEDASPAGRAAGTADQ
jgi:hypothetical protein